MALVNKMQIRQFAVYDGTNGTEVHGYSGGFLISDNGTVLEIGFSPSTVDLTFNIGDGWDLTYGGFWQGSDPAQAALYPDVVNGFVLRPN